ncbi:DUF4864 domain-containing protein [Solirubrobacter taibaiensis]|nr:DUF4864 domain-containing protein [Solirubrobacter taibaiensis]
MTATFEPAAPPKRRVGKIIAIVAAAVLAAIVALVVALVLFVNAATGDAEKVSAELVTAIQSNDGAKAYALGGADFRAIAPEAEVKEVVGFIAPLVERGKVSPDGKAIHASTDRGKVAVFTYTLKGTSGKPVYLKTQIQEKDGAWKVLSFKTADDTFDTDVE